MRSCEVAILLLRPHSTSLPIHQLAGLGTSCGRDYCRGHDRRILRLSPAPEPRACPELRPDAQSLFHDTSIHDPTQTAQ